MKAISLVLLASALSTAQQPPAFRLPADTVPTRYYLDLTLDPEKTDYSGDIAIDLEVRKTTSVIWLNASKVSIASASLEGTANQTAHILPGGDDFLGFQLIVQ
jgi:cytosol alanyl aminopeptidase